MGARRIDEYALGKPGAWPDQPFGDELVAKVGPAGAGKIFCFLGEGAIGVKCGRDRDEADEWLDRFPDDASVMAYLGRRGWNTLRIGAAIPDDELVEAIDDSYLLVVAKLPRRHRPEGWGG